MIEKLKLLARNSFPVTPGLDILLPDSDSIEFCHHRSNKIRYDKTTY